MPANFGLLSPLASYQATQSIPNAARLTVVQITAILPSVVLDLASSAVPGYLYVNTLDMSEAQFEASNASPLTIVPAPGVGKTILPLIGVLAFEITVGYALDRGWRFRYAGTVIEPIAQQTALGLTIIQKVSTLQLTSSQQNFSAPTLPENRALICGLNGSVSGGTVISVRSQVLYTIVNTPS